MRITELRLVILDTAYDRVRLSAMVTAPVHTKLIALMLKVLLNFVICDEENPSERLRVMSWV